ncbi:hypothetical protein M0812_14480 [Anaeramoeba flamelloides]|uniref:Glycosyl transferase family 1 domain-containing protein n=1 Tax=Anaeramoeba flamelloides TaxID=1746091 RepID=A0AAV7ZK37_9EUKA|nr:hypothetical protein M0812_14480 [Anaeramoeba flamelloides]
MLKFPKTKKKTRIVTLSNHLKSQKNYLFEKKRLLLILFVLLFITGIFFFNKSQNKQVKQTNDEILDVEPIDKKQFTTNNEQLTFNNQKKQTSTDENNNNNNNKEITKYKKKEITKHDSQPSITIFLVISESNPELIQELEKKVLSQDLDFLNRNQKESFHKSFHVDLVVITTIDSFLNKSKLGNNMKASFNNQITILKMNIDNHQQPKITPNYHFLLQKGIEYCESNHGLNDYLVFLNNTIPTNFKGFLKTSYLKIQYDNNSTPSTNTNNNNNNNNNAHGNYLRTKSEYLVSTPFFISSTKISFETEEPKEQLIVNDQIIEYLDDESEFLNCGIKFEFAGDRLDIILDENGVTKNHFIRPYDIMRGGKVLQESEIQKQNGFLTSSLFLSKKIFYEYLNSKQDRKKVFYGDDLLGILDLSFFIYYERRSKCYFNLAHTSLLLKENWAAIETQNFPLLQRFCFENKGYWDSITKEILSRYTLGDTCVILVDGEDAPTGLSTLFNDLLMQLDPYVDVSLKRQTKWKTLKNNLFDEWVLATRHRALSKPVMGESKRIVILNKHIPDVIQFVNRDAILVLRSLEELPVLPDEWVELVKKKIEYILVPSAWGRNIYINRGFNKDQIFILPLAVDEKLFFPVPRNKRLDPKKHFTFFSQFLGDFERKGVPYLIQAFLREFEPQDNVKLLIKTRNGQGARHAILVQLKTLNKPLTHFQMFSINENDLAQKEIAKLYLSADAYVTATGGEDWGRSIQEAMLTGMPVIATNYSAYLDFFNEHNGFPINCKMVGDSCFPKITHLRSTMRYVVDNYQEALKRGRSAREVILQHHNLDIVQKKLLRHLIHIQKMGKRL